VGILPAELTLSATSSSPATSSIVVVQPGLNGAFAFTYTGTGFSANGHAYTTGADLLSGRFTDGTIVAFGSSGSAEDSIVGGGTVSFASSVVKFANTGDEAFSIAFTSPNGLALSGSTLGGFDANSVGTYAVDTGSIVPEPGLWAMLILGFVSLGAVLRVRRGAGRAATSA
jgi:hypothetical protein